MVRPLGNRPQPAGTQVWKGGASQSARHPQMAHHDHGGSRDASAFAADFHSQSLIAFLDETACARWKRRRFCDAQKTPQSDDECYGLQCSRLYEA